METMADEQKPPFPQVSGIYRMTDDWSVSLPAAYSRRFEDDALVLSRPGITCYVIVWGPGNPPKAPHDMYTWRRDDPPPRPVATYEHPDGDTPRLAYLLREESEGSARWALYSFAFGRSGHVQFAIYFDRQEDLEVAKGIWMSLTEHASGAGS